MACDNYKPRIVSMHDERRTPMLVCANCGDLPNKHFTDPEVTTYRGFDVGQKVNIHSYMGGEFVGQDKIVRFVRKPTGMFAVFENSHDFGDTISDDAHITCLREFREIDKEPPEQEEDRHVSDIAQRIWGRMSDDFVSAEHVQEVLDHLADILRDDA